MFDSDDWDNFENHINQNHDFEVHWESNPFPVMEVVAGAAVVAVVLFVSLVLYACCCRRKTRGRVIAPPPPSETPAPYPQQQYTVTSYPTATVLTMGSATAYPTATPYPTAAPYPTGTPYPTGVLYPTSAPSSYPTPVPYPTGGPYPAAMPYGHAPSAPDCNAYPPPYDQAVSQIEKQPPFNPHAPH